MDAHTLLPPIIRFSRDHRHMPSVRELTALSGFRSEHAAAKVVAKLLAAGLLARDRPGKLLQLRVSLGGGKLVAREEPAYWLVGRPDFV
jgi:hypothetical protein